MKGAFSGAVKNTVGRFEAADGGTLFLDEISDISPFVQLKLLRFLQEKKFERVGENKARKSDVRIISATNKDLMQLIQDGTFREDLYYRLKVFPIILPPLRERKEDLPLLIDHFIEKFNQETEKQIAGYSRQAIAALLDYPWPGKCEGNWEMPLSMLLSCEKSGEIQLSDLPVEINRSQTKERDTSIGRFPQGTIPTSELNINSNERYGVSREELIGLLERFKWNKSEVARHLNLNRTTVWRLMKRYDIN